MIPPLNVTRGLLIFNGRNITEKYFICQENFLQKNGKSAALDLTYSCAYTLSDEQENGCCLLCRFCIRNNKSFLYCCFFFQFSARDGILPVQRTCSALRTGTLMADAGIKRESLSLGALRSGVVQINFHLCGIPLYFSAGICYNRNCFRLGTNQQRF